MPKIDPAWDAYQRRRFMTPDPERFWRPDAARWMTPQAARHVLPASMWPKEPPRKITAESFVEEQKRHREWEGDLAELRREYLALKWLLAERKLERTRQAFMAAKAYNSSQPRVPAGNSDGGQWASGSGGNQTVSDGDGREQQDEKPQQAFFDRRKAIAKAVEAAVALYTGLASRNSPDQQAVVTFTARDFPLAEGDFHRAASARLLTRDEVNAACPRLEEVQERTDVAARTIEMERRDLTPSQRGTAVHAHLKAQIDRLEDPDFRAERSFLKAKEDVQYGDKGSVRVDVFENATNDTVCVYDIKTGRSGLSMARSAEIVGHVYAYYPKTRRIIVTEVRPRR